MARADGPRVAIVGGGIGGLTGAGFLHRAGFPVTVYEQAPRLTEVGAGLVVSPNAVRVIRRIGGIGRFLARAVPVDVGFEFRRWADGRVLSAEDLTHQCELLYGERTYTSHRADLLAVLAAAIPADQIRLGMRCAAVEARAPGARLVFADGRRAEADIVIGADGVHSVVRGAVTEISPPEYSGLCAFRALVPAAQAGAFARRRAHTLWLGPGRHLVHYPVSRGDLVNLAAFAPAGEFVPESWSATAPVEEFLAEFEGWDPRVRALIRAGGTPGRWALLDRAPLRHWSAGPVTLLGDAAHAMFPFYAQGAAQAMEDGAALAACLAATPADPELALRRYEAVRMERTSRLHEQSRARARANHLADGPEQQARDEALRAADPLAASGWIYGFDVEAAVADTLVSG